jgi:hypothetical protein
LAVQHVVPRHEKAVFVLAVGNWPDGFQLIFGERYIRANLRGLVVGEFQEVARAVALHHAPGPVLVEQTDVHGEVCEGVETLIPHDGINKSGHRAGYLHVQLRAGVLAMRPIHFLHSGQHVDRESPGECPLRPRHPRDLVVQDGMQAHKVPADILGKLHRGRDHSQRFPGPAQKSDVIALEGHHTPSGGDDLIHSEATFGLDPVPDLLAEHGHDSVVLVVQVGEVGEDLEGFTVG